MSLISRLGIGHTKQPEHLELVMEGQKVRTHLNLEYLFDINHGWEFNKEYKGEILDPTVSQFDVRIQGKLLFSPLGDEKHNYEVALTYFYTPHDRGGRTDKKLYLPENPLQKYCEEHFPHLGIYGGVILASTPDLPGDTSGEEITQWFFSALENNPDIQRVSKAHKLLIEELIQPIEKGIAYSIQRPK